MSVSDGTRCLLCTDVFAMRIRHLPTNQDCRFFRQEIGWFFPSTSVAAGDIRQDIEGLILMHSSTFSLIPESSNGTMWRIKEFGLWRPVRVFPWNLDFGFLKQLHEMRWKWCGNSFFLVKKTTNVKSLEEKFAGQRPVVQQMDFRLKSLSLPCELLKS